MKNFQREKRFPNYAIACFYILTGCIICSALFLYGSSLFKNSAAASSDSLFTVSASEDDSFSEDTLTIVENDDVSSVPDVEEDTAAMDTGEEHYYSFVTSNVKTVLHVRVQPDMDAQIIYRLTPGTTGYVLERGEDWSLVKNSDVTGYVSNRYLQFQEIPKEEYLQQVEDTSQ